MLRGRGSLVTDGNPVVNPLPAQPRPDTSVGEPAGSRLRVAPDLFTVGVEEEFLLIDLDSPSVVGGAADVVERAAGDPRFRMELPPCQIEMATAPRRSVLEIEADLRSARHAVAEWCSGLARPVSAALHPTDATFATAATTRGIGLVSRYGWLARSQLLGSVQVHVAVSPPDRLIAVHDELRSYLPYIAALAAAGPFAHREDRGVASMRPFICQLLPRQGIPPALRTWEAFTAEVEWGMESGVMVDPTNWWWELRPHPRYGTLEIRVADAQPRVADSMAVVELTLALVRWLAARADVGDLPTPAATWRIEENRWSAAMDGVGGTFADLETGLRRPTTEMVATLIDEVEPWSERGLDSARVLLGAPSHERIRSWGLHDTIDRLVGSFIS